MTATFNGRTYSDSACAYKPLADYVLLEEIESLGKSNIAMPDGVHARARRARVVAVGPGKFELGQLVPMQLKVGDVVLLFSGENDPPYLDVPMDDGRKFLLQRAYYLRLVEA